jgi:hypothetical protein
MEPKDLAIEYFEEGRVMQLATLHDNAPRVVSVYYVVVNDDLGYIYWMSEPRRRHSQDIDHDFRAAGAVAIKLGQPVIGLQFTGYASVVTDLGELSEVITRYNHVHHNTASGLFERINAGTNKHVIYRMAIETLELFDGIYFPDGNVVQIPLD